MRKFAKISDLYNLSLALNASDDVELGELRVKICRESGNVSAGAFAPLLNITSDCVEEIYSGISEPFIGLTSFSEQTWNWVLDKTVNGGRILVSVVAIDGAGNKRESGSLFSIVNDGVAPAVSISHSSLDVSEGKQVTLSASANDNFGEIEKIEIYVDGEIAQLCQDSACLSSRIYSGGQHSYYATAYDLSGNFGTSSAGTFSTSGEPQTCAAFFGQVCENGTACSQPTFSASDTSRCCSGTCDLQIISLSCEEQEGTIFNPNSNTCSGTEVLASDTGELLSCCKGNLSEISSAGQPGPLGSLGDVKIYWVDVKGKRLLSAFVGTDAKCIVSGTGSGTIIIYRDGEVLSSSEASLPLSVSRKIDEEGGYECEFRIGEDSLTAGIKAVQLPAGVGESAVLPVFGWANFAFALIAVVVYGFILRRVKIKNGN